MKLTVFRSNDGDCLLLRGSRTGAMLIDGGRADSYTSHVAPALGGLRDEGVDLDVVCVSHIDDDHISGVLRLLNDEVEWRVFDLKRETGPGARPPRSPRPPTIHNIWHNAFRNQVEDNEGEIREMLAASTRILLGASGGPMRRLGELQANLVNGESSAIRVSQRIGDKQLKIPLNAWSGKRLLMVREGLEAEPVGSMKVTLLAPYEDDLARVRDEWNTWLRKYRTVVTELEEKALFDERRLGTGAESLLRPMDIVATELGDRGGVTAPNLASIMLLVEEAGRSALLTGDGHADEVLKGLRGADKLKASGLHVDVFKVPHHGAEFNSNEELAKSITADHYVFCGDGNHHNPDLAVLNLYLDSRLGEGDAVSRNRKAKQPFKFWFSSSTVTPSYEDRREHMVRVEELVKARAEAHPGRFSYEFLDDSSFDIVLSPRRGTRRPPP